MIDTTYKYRRTFLFKDSNQIENFLSIINEYTENIVTFGTTVVIEDKLSFALCRKITNLANLIRNGDPYAIEHSGLEVKETNELLEKLT